MIFLPCLLPSPHLAFAETIRRARCLISELCSLQVSFLSLIPGDFWATALQSLVQLLSICSTQVMASLGRDVASGCLFTLVPWQSTCPLLAGTDLCQHTGLLPVIQAPVQWPWSDLCPNELPCSGPQPRNVSKKRTHLLSLGVTRENPSSKAFWAEGVHKVSSEVHDHPTPRAWACAFISLLSPCLSDTVLQNLSHGVLGIYQEGLLSWEPSPIIPSFSWIQFFFQVLCHVPASVRPGQ